MNEPGQFGMIDKLGKYRIDSVLGKGAMGVVYKAFDPHIERTVALKTIRKELFSAAEQVELIARFKNEAQAAGRLNHPNIVTVYDYGEDTDCAFIAMEFVDGTPLNTLLVADKATDLARVTAWTTDLLLALEYAHSRGVIHRDIKPANLLITRSGRVKVSDFGIARIDSSTLTQTGSMIGTPSYMSPEQFRGETVDGRCDVFSAGIVLYQLLTGARPFVGSTSVVMQQILNEMPLPPSRSNPALGGAVDRMLACALAKAPADRYASAQDFLDAFNAAQRDHEADPDATMLAYSDHTVLASEVRSAMPGAQRGGPSVDVTTFASSGGSGPGLMTLAPWKMEALPALDTLLTRQIGPMAKLLLKKAAAKAEDIDALCNLLLPHIPSDVGRAKFKVSVNEIKKKLDASGTGTRTTADSGTSSLRSPHSRSDGVQGSATDATRRSEPVKFDEAFAEAAARQLTVFIGPIARVVAKRAMRQTQDKTEFLRLMAEQIATLPERTRFLVQAGNQ